MNLTTEQLLRNAMEHLDQAQGDIDFAFSRRLTQQSIAYSLLAVAQELYKINEREEIEIECQEWIQVRKD